MSEQNKVIFITGASTGLGLALANELRKDSKNKLVLTARKSSIHRFSEHGIYNTDNNLLLELDVTNRNQRINAVNKAIEHFGRIDVLVNNAGLALRSVVEDASASDRMNILNVNYISPMRLIALVLPFMRKRRSGQIINISSAAGLVGMPTMASYCGSKFAIEGSTESLWYEVKPWNIKVSLIIPGFINSDAFTKTRLTTQSLNSILSKGRDPYFYHYKYMENLISWTMKRTSATPESIAVKISKAIQTNNPPLRIPVTIDAWVLHLFRRFLPRAIYHWVMYKFLPKSSKWGKDHFRERFVA